MADHPVQISIGATLAASLGSAVKGAQSQLTQLGSTMAEIGNKQSGIRQLDNMRSQTAQAAQAMRAAQQKVTGLQAAMASGDTEPTKRQIQELERARAAAAKAESAYRNQRAAVDELSSSLQKSGVNLKATASESAKLGQQMEVLRSRTDALNKAQQAQQRNMEARSAYRSQMLDAVALGAALVTPVRVAMGFEQAMAEVGAVSRASAEDMSVLTAQARELGAKTAWSASQAAEGMKYLAMAGFTTEQTLEAMPGMLDLASAGAVDLGRAADISSNILSGFNLEASEMGRVGDVLTNAFTASNTSLESLGESMKYVAPIAAATGTSIEEAAAMVGKLGDAGIQGSQAGTALRAVLNRIAAPAGNAQKTLDLLGIATQDAAGNMRPIIDVMGDIGRATEKMGTAQRAEVVSTIFGLEAASAATVLMGQATSGALDQFTEKLKETGSAEEVARRQTDTTQGAMIRLGSALEAVAISVGNVLLPPLAALADRVAVVTEKLSSWAEAHPLLTKVLVGGTAAAIALKVATIGLGYAWTFVKGPFLMANTAFASARAGLALLQVQSAATGSSAGLLTAAWSRMKLGATGLLAPLKAAALSFWSMLPAIWATTTALLANPITWIVVGIGAAVAGLAIVIRKYWEPVAAYLGGVWDGIKAGFMPVITGVTSAMTPLEPVGRAIGNVLGYIGGAIGSVVGWFKQLISPVTLAEDEFESISASGRSLGEVVGTVLGTAFNVLTFPIRAVVTAVGAVIDAFSAVMNIGGELLGSLSSLPGSFMELGGSLLSGLADGIIGGAKKAISAVGDVASGVRDKFKSMLGINSPSRVFAALGGNISQGLAEGVEDQAPSVLSQIGTLAQSMQDSAFKLPSILLGSAAALLPASMRPSQLDGTSQSPGQALARMSAQSLHPAVAATSVAALPGGAATNDVTIHLSVTAPPGSDSHDMAALIEERLRELMRQITGGSSAALYD